MARLCPKATTVASVKSNYGTDMFGTSEAYRLKDPNSPPHGTTNKYELFKVRSDNSDDDKVFLGTVHTRQTYRRDRVLILGWAANSDSLEDNKTKFSNVRINDGGEIVRPLYDVKPSFLTLTQEDTRLGQADLVFGQIKRLDVHHTATVTVNAQDVSVGNVPADVAENQIYVEPPHQHRDFPQDVFDSDETYTISAWAVNEDDEVISPVVSLTVRPGGLHGVPTSKRLTTTLRAATNSWVTTSPPARTRQSTPPCSRCSSRVSVLK